MDSREAIERLVKLKATHLRHLNLCLKYPKIDGGKTKIHEEKEIAAFDAAITALNAEAERQKGCKWCTPDGKFWALVTYAVVDEALIEEAKQHEQPQFCCQCGRKLSA